MKKWGVILLFLAMLLGSGGCRPKGAGEFAIYLLAGETRSAQLAQVRLDDLELQEQPFLTIQDILAYDQQTHELELSEKAYRRLQALFGLPVKVDGLPFVVCVGGERIYAGAFWTPLSSLSFDGVTILQPLSPDQRTIRIELGYPSPQAFRGADPRSDPRILESLKAAGVLE